MVIKHVRSEYCQLLPKHRPYTIPLCLVETLGHLSKLKEQSLFSWSYVSPSQFEDGKMHSYLEKAMEASHLIHDGHDYL